MARNLFLLSALKYAASGWPVFPVIARGKVPLTGNGFKDATLNPETIRMWWAESPNANIGVPTGAASGTVVLDVDGPDGNAGLESIGATVPTRTSCTGKGRHLVFRHPGGTIQNRTKLRPDLDVRGDGGYIVVPPSVHPGGHRYKWDRASGMGWDLPLASLPSRTLEVLRNGHGRASVALALPDAIPEGRRNSTLTSLAGSMRRRGADEGAIVAALQITNLRCVPPLPAEELATITRSVGRYPVPVQTLVPSGAAADADDDDQEPSPRNTKQADLLIRLGQMADLFHAPDRVVYASIHVNGRRETHSLRRSGFRHWLTREFYRSHGTAPGAQAMQNALAVLEAQALYDGPEIPTFLRVGESDGAIYLDLGDDQWQAVRITRDGWEVVATAECRFRRAPGIKPLPLPIRGGHIDALRRFVNVSENRDFHLLVGALLSAFRPRGPYPIVNYQGEQGSAKTTTARVQRALCDPATAPMRTMPRDVRELLIAATNGWLLAFDNVSSLAPWVSDALCRLATGGGSSTRQLYTDQDEVLFDVTRPVILTGIEDVVERDDLRDRAVILTLPPIPDGSRRDEQAFWSAFEKARPLILGAVLDAVVRAVRDLDVVTLPDLPRMADFARWTTAGESAFGWTPGTITDAYALNRGAAVQQFLDGDRFATAIMEEIGESFSGNSLKLLAFLNGKVTEKDRGPDWPKSARGVSGHLRRLSPALRRQGYEVEFPKHRTTKRAFTITVKKSGGYDRHNGHDRHDNDGYDGHDGHLPGFSREAPGPADGSSLPDPQP